MEELLQSRQCAEQELQSILSVLREFESVETLEFESVTNAIHSLNGSTRVLLESYLPRLHKSRSKEYLDMLLNGQSVDSLYDNELNVEFHPQVIRATLTVMNFLGMQSRSANLLEDIRLRAETSSRQSISSFVGSLYELQIRAEELVTELRKAGALNDNLENAIKDLIFSLQELFLINTELQNFLEA